MRIVVLDGETLNPGDNPWDAVSALGEMQVYARTSAAETVERSLDADVLLTNKVALDADVLAQLPNLKFIAVTATGYNVVDVKAANVRGIPVSNVPVYGTDSVAQHVMASILSWIHKPQEHHQAIQAGQWQASKSFSFWLSPLTELSGKTMGVVGLGRIGRATAKLAAAFGMKVIASSRTQANPLDVDGFEWKSVEALFSSADFVSLHCPQTPETQGFVNASLLGAMKPTAVLINTARGGLINESDLAEALNSDVLAAALLDVVTQEPIVDSNPLLNAKNCVLTPHIAWTAIEARRRLMQTTADNVAAFLAGSPQNLVSG